MKKIWKKGVLQVILAMIMLISQIMTVSATGVDQMPPLEEERKGTLSASLSYKNGKGEKVAIQGVTLEVFRVAELEVINGGSSKYTLTSDFAGSEIELEGISASESNKAAKTMKAIVLEKELKGQAAVTDANGKVVFQNLEPGMYLVMQTANEDTVPEYTEMDPYLVSVPLGETSDGGNTWKYEVNTVPKAEIGRKPREGSIEVTKKTSLSVDGELVVMNSIDSTFYVGLFKDAEGTKLYSEDSILPIRLVNSSAGTVEFANLTEGTYYVFETTEDGKAIKPGESVDDGFVAYTCTVEGNGEQKVVLDPNLGEIEGKVVFNNVYTDFPDGYYVEAEIEIKKSVFLGNDRVRVEDTFYAGIFTKEDDEYILNQVVELKQNDSVTVPVLLQGEEGKEAATYWVFETDSKGNRIDKELFSYEVSGEGSVTLSADKLSDQIEIENIIKEEETETESESETETTKTVETGDGTPIEQYMLLLAGSILLMLVLVGSRLLKRNK